MTPLRLDECGSVLTVAELERVLKIGRRQAYDLIRRREIYAVKIGRSLRIPRSAVEEFLHAQPPDSVRLAVVKEG